MPNPFRRGSIYAIGKAGPPGWLRRRLPRIGPLTSMVDEIVWEGTFDGRFSDKAHAIAVYERHVEEVKRHVPADRLLVFDVRDGWAPLCAFLGVPEPTTPFPHLNDTAEFRANIRRIEAGWLAARVIAGAAVVGGLGLLAWWAATR